MAHAIITKLLGPTNAKGDRIKATSAYGSITVGYHSAPDDRQGLEARNRGAAEQLIVKMNLERTSDQSMWYLVETDGLAMPDGTGFAFGACLG